MELIAGLGERPRALAKYSGREWLPVDAGPSGPALGQEEEEGLEQVPGHRARSLELLSVS